MFKKALIVMIAAEGLSLAVFNFPAASLPLLIIIGIGSFVLSFFRPDLGIYLLFGELFVGSRGHLLEYDFDFASISLRLVIFTTVFMAWFIKFVIPSASGQALRYSEGSQGDSSSDPGRTQNDKAVAVYYLLLLVIAFGIINGYLRGNGIGNVFNDANGYLYLLILPAALSAINTREQIQNILQILAAAVLVIAGKTLTLFIWFTFDLPAVVTAYHWIISQDFGEITGEVGSASRIFMQSQFYSLLGLFIFGLQELPQPPLYQRGGKGGVLNWLIILAAILSIIMSLSRSFWLGAMAGGVFALIMLLWHFRAGFKQALGLGLKILLIAIIEIAALYLLINLGSSRIADAVASRGLNPTQEAAGGARLLLLPELLDSIKQSPLIGSGFGKEVTYKSYLPDRVTLENPDGEITGYAFEWGYLDTWLKIGLVGLIIYLLFIAAIFQQGWNIESRISNLGFLSGLVALLVLNITTPYLNHPLGIGFLILSYSRFAILNSRF